jgi:hypothetical protein
MADLGRSDINEATRRYERIHAELRSSLSDAVPEVTGWWAVDAPSTSGGRTRSLGN